MPILEKRVGKKGEIIIPKEWRKELSLKSGSGVLLEKFQNKIILRPEVKDPVKALASLNLNLGKKSSVELIREIREEAERELEHLIKK